MTKRAFALAIATLALVAYCHDICYGSNARETPLVLAVKRAKASVVNIHTEKSAEPSDSIFTAGKRRKVNGMGTGIVIDPRGYIVTNFHVVDGVDPQSIRVTLCDGSTFQAPVISFDRKHDLAIIKIDTAAPLAVMPMGTSSDLMLGETVFAVGNAYGYEHTVTCGIVSHLSRDVEVNEKQSYNNLIQTDASINPGNSGGPLLNLMGEVVGVNVAIRAGAQRIGFAIPIDDARRVIARLLSIEQLNDTYHGAIVSDLKSGPERKLLVTSTIPGSPAERAGIQVGDVISKAGTVHVVDGADFERALLERRRGEEVNLVVQRDDHAQNLVLKIGVRPNLDRQAADQPVVVRANNSNEENTSMWEAFGLRLAPVDVDDKRMSGTRYRGGMQVVAVRSESLAARNGIVEGDILIGLHQWETLKPSDVDWVLSHPEFDTFAAPLKFYVLRNRMALEGFFKASRQ